VFDFCEDKRYVGICCSVQKMHAPAYLRMRKVRFKNEIFQSFSFLVFCHLLTMIIYLFIVSGYQTLLVSLICPNMKADVWGAYFSHVSANKPVQFFRMTYLFCYQQDPVIHALIHVMLRCSLIDLCWPALRWGFTCYIVWGYVIPAPCFLVRYIQADVYQMMEGRRGEAPRPTLFTTLRRLWRMPRRRHMHILDAMKLCIC
jgi:hypothetical protein